MPFSNYTLNDGRKIPEIAFGTGSVFKLQDITDHIIQALQAGYTHLDSAQAYENEGSIRAALKLTGVPRENVFVTTKYLFMNNWGKAGIRGELVISLEKLGLDYIDLYLIHAPDNLEDRLPEIWKEMEAVKREGLARSIGVSNFKVKHLEEITAQAEILPAVNQIPFNPYRLAEQEPLLEYCKKHNIVIEAWSPLGPLTRNPNGPVDAPVNRIAERMKATPSQVLLLWQRAKGVVIVTTTGKKDRLEEYLRTTELPPLTEEDVAAIDEAGRQPAPPKKY